MSGKKTELTSRAEFENSIHDLSDGEVTIESVKKLGICISCKHALWGSYVENSGRYNDTQISRVELSPVKCFYLEGFCLLKNKYICQLPCKCTHYRKAE